MSCAVVDPRRRSWSRAVVWLTALLVALGWSAVATRTAHADGPTTIANATSISIPVTGSPNQIGPASPYPSSIAVSGLTGSVTKVTVTFAGLTHSTLNDIDAMVVAPDGSTNLVVLSDVGDPNALRTVNGATLTFDDAGADMPSQVVIPSGTYKPTNVENGADAFPAPAPQPSNQTSLAGAFTGIDPNGTWSLYVVDDSRGDTGVMSGGWSLTVTTATAAKTTATTVTSSDATSTTGDPVAFTALVQAAGTPVTSGSVQFSSDGTNLGAPVPLSSSGQARLTTSALREGTHLIRAVYSGATGFLTSNGSLDQRVDNETVVSGRTFCNPGPITVPNSGTASPYPSNVVVRGLSGSITAVTAQLRGVSHAAPIDLDVMLYRSGVSRPVMLLSDAGGQNAVSDVDLTFDDAAAGGVPAPMISGTYRPTDLDPDGQVDQFPAPAPAPNTTTDLSVFDGGDPNGTWSLWVVDDATGDAGSITDGWCVTISSKSATTTALTTSPDPAPFGSAVTFRAAVAAGASPAAGGTVQFTVDGQPFGAPVTPASNGTATLSTSALAVGTHRIGATYSGTDDLIGSSDAVDQVVQKATTTTTLTSDLNPSTVGDQVAFTARITSPTATVGEGSVVFSVDGADLPAVAVGTSGEVTYTTSALSAGTHQIAARYAGTASFADSDDELKQVVDRIVTSTALTAAPNPSTFGTDVTITATVTSGGTTVGTGTVQFSVDGSTTGAPVAVGADGTAILTTAALGVGDHEITAAYAGTTRLAPSEATLTQVVGTTVSTTTLTGSPNPSTFGTDVTFTATVTAGGAPVTSGTVQFSVDGSALGEPVAVGGDGTATLTTAALGVGEHAIAANFSGNGTVAESSGGLSQSVIKAVSTTTITADRNPTAFGQPVVFTASVTSGGKVVTSGSVLFTDQDAPISPPVELAADGTASWTVTTLALGDHEVKATFKGTSDIDTSSARIDHEVSLVPTTTQLVTSPDPSELGSVVAFSARVQADGFPADGGTVTFSVDGTVIGASVPLTLQGTAEYTTASLTAGIHVITATYSGSTPFAASESEQVTQTVSPVADAGGPYAIAEGEAVTLDASGSSPGATYSWDVGDDGTVDAVGADPTLSWSELVALGVDDGTDPPTEVPVRLVVQSGGQTTDASTVLAVANTAPASVVTGSAVATVGQPFTVKVGADDPSPVDLAAQFDYTVDWGDGSPVLRVTGPADPPVTHTYSRAGLVSAVFTATDKDGDKGERTVVSVRVVPASSPSPTPPPSDRPTNGPTSGPTSGPDRDLANTGADAGTGWLLVLGSALVTGGALLVLAGRRRTCHHLHRS